MNYDMIYTILGKRFHECLNEESKSAEKADKYREMSDYMLVHSVCRRERLTFFNFLRLNKAAKNDEEIKDMLNREYALYFRRGNAKLDIYREEGAFFKKPAFNEVNRRFKV